MFFKKDKVRVVAAQEYTDYTERFEEMKKIRNESQYATRKDVLMMSALPVVGAAGVFAYNKATNEPSQILEVTAPMAYQPAQTVPDITSLTETYTAMAVNVPVQTGVIADKSLEMLANALDPLVQILVAISFPIASVIMVGACFFFMIGNPEKAWSMIMNAGLGYVLIQISPLFLDILRNVGEAI